MERKYRSGRNEKRRKFFVGKYSMKGIGHLEGLDLDRRALLK